jgi:flagellar biosynthesis/type III secretory pathway chaperone
VTLSPSPAGQIAALVRAERAGVQALLEALSAERQLLAEGDTDRLTEIGVRKRELLLNIAQLGEQRNRLLHRQGVSSDSRSLRAFMNNTAATEELRAEWRMLLDTTEQARRLNDANGLIIEAGMRTNQQALSMLLSAASGGTYGPGGHTTNPLSSRSLASA